jgi:hypothetical protein
MAIKAKYSPWIMEGGIIENSDNRESDNGIKR